MSIDPRAALDRFIAALEAHFELASSAQDPESPAIEDAAATVEDAFFTYDDALYTAYQVEIPLEAYGDDDDDLDEDDDLEDFSLDEVEEE
ncbi:DNA primase [Georgenia sp. Marseille-Q6866]